MTEKQDIPRIKKTTIHKLLNALSPKRTVDSPQKGRRDIPRGISPKALEYLTGYINSHIRDISEALELALEDINNNPNSYYNQHRINLQVVELAIKKLEEERV